jgi:tetratricopeptide (TPR) repeat protein
MYSFNQNPAPDPIAKATLNIELGKLVTAERILIDLISSDESVSERGVQARTALAEVYEGLGQYDSADEALAPYDVRALEDFAPHLRGLILLAFGSRAYWQNDFPRSVTLLNRAREILGLEGDAASLARAYHCLGRAYWALDEQPLAREHYELAIEWSRRTHRDRALAITYMNLGLLARHEGDFDEAGMCYRRALNLLRHTTDDTNRARLQNNLGVMLLYQGNLYEAANALRRALEHLAGSQNDLLLGMVYNNLAITSLYTGEWAVAESHAQQALRIARASGDHLCEGRYTGTLGALRSYQGRVEEANELLRFALARAKETGSKKDETQALLSLAKLWLMARKMHRSLTYTRNARDLARKINDERFASEAALLMIEGYRRSDKWMAAENWATVAQAELEHLPYSYLDAVLQRNLASFISRRRDPSKGERLFQQTEEAFRSMNAAYQVAVTIFEHGESLIRRGDRASAYLRILDASRQFWLLGAQLDAKQAEKVAHDIDPLARIYKFI